MTLLEPRLLARLEALQLATRRPLAGHLAGEHRSTRFGSSIDFADYRDYHPGDDFRRIDYHLLARLDVALIKLFDAEEDINVRLLVDTSASMATAGKLHQAARIAAAVGFVALVRRDPVTLHTFPLDRAPARFLGRNAVPRLFSSLESLVPDGGTPFASAASHLLARRGPKGATIVVSDLLTPEWEAGIERLPASGHEVVVVHVLASEDLVPHLSGDLDLVDREDASRVAVSLTSDTRASYTAAANRWREAVAERTRQAGASYVSMLADDDLESLLLGAWRRTGVLR